MRKSEGPGDQFYPLGKEGAAKGGKGKSEKTPFVRGNLLWCALQCGNIRSCLCVCVFLSIFGWGEIKKQEALKIKKQEIKKQEALCGKVVCSDGVPANNLKHSCSLWDFYYIIDVEVLLMLVLEDFCFQFVRRHFSQRVLNLTNQKVALCQQV